MQDIQSAANIQDVVLDREYKINYRDGVCIAEITGVVKGSNKYDFEVLERGASGELNITITFRGKHCQDEKGTLLPETERGIAVLLELLKQGLRLGAHTAKGLGQAACNDVKAYYYDFKNKESVLAYLSGDKNNRALPDFLYEPVKTLLKPAEDTFVVDGYFSLMTSLIVRNYVVNGTGPKEEANAIPLESGPDYLIPGSSLKGVMKKRAAYILRRIGVPREKEGQLLDQLLGTSDEKKKIKSRFIVDEMYVSKNSADICEYTQTRNRIDRFTGGTMGKALFSTKALWKNGTGAPLHLHFEIHNCKKWEAALALFILKDFWQGKIALGGEKAIGRGLLHGHRAKIVFGSHATWVLEEDGRVAEGAAGDLEALAGELKRSAREEWQ